MLLQLVCVRKGVVAKIHVALERKRELAIDEKSRGGWFVVEPVEYGLEGVEALVKGEHRLGRQTVVVYRHLGWEG